MVKNAFMHHLDQTDEEGGVWKVVSTGFSIHRVGDRVVNVPEDEASTVFKTVIYNISNGIAQIIRDVRHYKCQWKTYREIRK